MDRQKSSSKLLPHLCPSRSGYGVRENEDPTCMPVENVNVAAASPRRGLVAPVAPLRRATRVPSEWPIMLCVAPAVVSDSEHVGELPTGGVVVGMRCLAHLFGGRSSLRYRAFLRMRLHSAVRPIRQDQRLPRVCRLETGSCQSLTELRRRGTRSSN